MEQRTVRGSCLCQAIQYEVRLPFVHFLYCHCSRCRKASGTAHAANAIVAPDAFHWLSGEAEAARYDLPTARSFSTSFCRHCGAPVPRLTRGKTRIIIPAGSLDDVPDTKPAVHVHWASRAEWYEDDPDLPKLPESLF